MRQALIPAALAAAALISPNLAHAIPVTYYAKLSGPNEAPANASPALGYAEVVIDVAASTMEVIVSFRNLVGTTTASHIHCCTGNAGAGTAGVATVTPSFTGFPNGVSSLVVPYDRTFNMAVVAGSFNTAYVNSNGGTAASAFTALVNGINAGKAYLNIHTTSFPGGEIRGFLAPVPEAGTAGMLATGLLAIALGSRRRAR